MTQQAIGHFMDAIDLSFVYTDPFRKTRQPIHHLHENRCLGYLTRGGIILYAITVSTSTHSHPQVNNQFQAIGSDGSF